jgi:hypothetical protein
MYHSIMCFSTWRIVGCVKSPVATSMRVVLPPVSASPVCAGRREYVERLWQSVGGHRTCPFKMRCLCEGRIAAAAGGQLRWLCEVGWRGRLVRRAGVASPLSVLRAVTSSKRREPAGASRGARQAGVAIAFIFNLHSRVA